MSIPSSVDTQRRAGRLPPPARQDGAVGQDVGRERQRGPEWTVTRNAAPSCVVAYGFIRTSGRLTNAMMISGAAHAPHVGVRADRPRAPVVERDPIARG